MKSRPWVAILIVVCLLSLAGNGWLIHEGREATSFANARTVNFTNDYLLGLREAREAARAETVDWRHLDAGLAFAQQAANGARLMLPHADGLPAEATLTMSEGLIEYFRAPISEAAAGGASPRDGAKVVGLLEALNVAMPVEVDGDGGWEGFIDWSKRFDASLRSIMAGLPG